MKYTDKAQETVNALLARFQSGDIAPIVNVATIHLTPEEQRQAIPSMKWSFRNQVIALFQTGTEDCRGFMQWQEAGRSVKKGSHAAYILGPIVIKKKDEETGKEQTALVGFKSIPVFSVNDTDGAELPEYKAPERPLPPLAEAGSCRHPPPLPGHSLLPVSSSTTGLIPPGVAWGVAHLPTHTPQDTTHTHQHTNTHTHKTYTHTQNTRGL
jgi:hypothetical protein